MFLQSLYVQWRWSQKILGALAFFAFGFPLFITRLRRSETFYATDQMSTGMAIGVVAAFLAIASAVLLAVIGYGVDERNRHTYTLSLPITRWQYVVQRAGGSCILLLIPVIALWLGCVVALATANVSAPLRSYPGTLALRTLLASWLTFAAYFAIRHLAGKYFRRVVLSLMVGGVAFVLATALSPKLNERASNAAEWFIDHPGPFGIFFGNWTLIDV